MKLKALLTDDDAVSPVIGVILMVAITVILAAVIASFVLGLGDEAQQTTPTADFSGDWEDCGSGDGYTTITHKGGDKVQADELYVRGSGWQDSDSSCSPTLDYSQTSGDFNWADDGPFSSSSEVSSGQSVDIGAADDYEFDIVYEANKGDNTATLTSISGPEA